MYFCSKDRLVKEKCQPPWWRKTLGLWVLLSTRSHIDSIPISFHQISWDATFRLRSPKVGNEDDRWKRFCRSLSELYPSQTPERVRRTYGGIPSLIRCSIVAYRPKTGSIIDHDSSIMIPKPSSSCPWFCGAPTLSRPKWVPGVSRSESGGYGTQ